MYQKKLYCVLICREGGFQGKKYLRKEILEKRTITKEVSWKQN